MWLSSLRNRYHDTQQQRDKVHDVPPGTCRSSDFHYYTDRDCFPCADNAEDQFIPPFPSGANPTIHGSFVPSGRYRSNDPTQQQQRPNTHHHASLWIQRLYATWWRCTFGTSNPRGMSVLCDQEKGHSIFVQIICSRHSHHFVFLRGDRL